MNNWQNWAGAHPLISSPRPAAAGGEDENKRSKRFGGKERFGGDGSWQRYNQSSDGGLYFLILRETLDSF